MLPTKFIPPLAYMLGTCCSLIFLIGSINSSPGQTGIANLGDPCGENHPPCNASLHLECVEGTCACVTGYSSDRYRNCKMSYGMACAVVLDCNIDRFLRCDDSKKCSCFKPEEQIFDEERLSCVGLIGHKCDHAAGEEFALNCVPNAFCDMPIINGSMIHRCTCNEGYEPMDDKLCRLA